MSSLLRAAMSAVLILLAGVVQAQSDAVRVLSGRSGQPVAGAAVQVDGFGTFVVPSDGIVYLSGVPAKTRMTIRAEGYLNGYVTPYVPGSTLFLIPDDERVSYATIKSAIYDNKDTGRLEKSVASVHTVFPDGNIRNDRRAFDALNWAVGKLNETRERQLEVFRPGSTMLPVYVVAENDQTASDHKIVIERNNTDPVYSKPGYEQACALTWNNHDNKGFITSSRILFCDELVTAYFDRHLRRVFLHELAHTLGLGHLRPEDPEGVMGGNGSDAPWDFTDQEMDLLMILTVRSANNAPVDDSIVGGATTASLKFLSGIRQPDFVEPRP